MEAPKAYKDAGLMHLIAGILNIITGSIGFLTMFVICIGFFWLIPAAIGCWQAWVGWQMYNGQRNNGVKNMGIIGIVASLCNFNVFAIVLSVLAFQKAKEPEVAGYIGG